MQTDELDSILLIHNKVQYGLDNISISNHHIFDNSQYSLVSYTYIQSSILIMYRLYVWMWIICAMWVPLRKKHRPSRCSIRNPLQILWNTFHNWVCIFLSHGCSCEWNKKLFKGFHLLYAYYYYWYCCCDGYVVTALTMIAFISYHVSKVDAHK